MMILVVTHHADNLCSRIVLIRDVPSHHFPQQNTKTIDIRGALVFPSLQDLRGHPMRSTNSDILILHLVFGGIYPGKSEIA